MDIFVQRIITFRWVIIVFVLVLSGFWGYQMRNLTINSDILSTLPDDDPTAILFNNIGDEFGGNDIGMIVLETNDVFSLEVLEDIKQITDSLRILDGVSSVTSLTNILNIKSSDWGIEIGNLVDEYNLPDEQLELDSLKRYVLSKDMYKGAIVSADGTATTILCTLLPDADVQSVAYEIKDKVEDLDLPETIYYGGLPFMLNDITDLIITDMLWLIPIVFVVIAFILLIGFRSLRGMILPLLTSGITVIWTLGIMAFLKFEITIISNIIPVVLLAIGSAYTIHVINSINLNTLQNRKQALIKALAYTIIPVTLASVTTAIGFVSFIFGAYLTMIKDFGICTAIGIIIALLLSVFFIPALISAFSIYRKIPTQEPDSNKNLMARLFLLPIVNVLFKYPKQILITWVLLLLIGTGGIFQIETSVNITDYFKKDNPARVSENIMQDKFGGSLPTYVLFRGDVQDPELLKMMITTEQFMKEDPNIFTAQSVANLVEQMNDAMGEGLRIPDEKIKIEQLWFLLDGQEAMSQLVSDDLDMAVIQSKFASIETDEIESYTERMNQFIDVNQGNDYEIDFTGTPSLYVQLNDSLVKSQFSSLVIAIILVLAIVGMILKSFRNGLLATVPIIATIIILLGFMGYAGIPLDIATVLVGSIALGIGIDYSIHVVSGYSKQLLNLGNTSEAISKTILTIGRAVVINVASVTGGFLVLLFAQVLPVQNFGLLIAISMIGSGLGALTLLPVIIILTNRNSQSKELINT